LTAPTTMTLPVEVDAPSIERYVYGLLSAARITTAPDLRWEAFGVNYVADSCGPSGGVWPNPCERLNPGPATVYTAQIDKPGGSNNLYVTLIANAYGPRVPVTVTVGTADPQELMVGQRSEAVEVTENTTVTITAAIPATGDYPACSNDVDAAIPATEASFSTTLSCTATIPTTAELTKTIDTGLSLVSGASFIVYEGLSCGSLTEDESAARAANRLALHEQYWVERQVDIGLLRQDVVVLGGGTATGMVHGVGLLEQAIAATYGGIGVIHAARELAAPMTYRALVRRDGARLRSPLDNLLAFGAGYSTAGPDGTDAPAGQAWLYATGPVVVRRGEVQNREAFDQRRNTRMALAERSYAVTADCLRVAVLIEIPEA
jgi:hypothetical protein